MVLAGEWKKRNRRALGIVLLVLALMMIVGLVGCGGGSSGGGGGGGGRRHTGWKLPDRAQLPTVRRARTAAARQRIR